MIWIFCRSYQERTTDTLMSAEALNTKKSKVLDSLLICTDLQSDGYITALGNIKHQACNKLNLWHCDMSRGFRGLEPMNSCGKHCMDKDVFVFNHKTTMQDSFYNQKRRNSIILKQSDRLWLWGSDFRLLFTKKQFLVKPPHLSTPTQMLHGYLHDGFPHSSNPGMIYFYFFHF